MNRVLQLPLGANAPPVVESYTLGDVLICKANRGKLLEVEHPRPDAARRRQLPQPARLLRRCTARRRPASWTWCIPGGELGCRWTAPDKFGRLAHCSAAINGHLDVVTYLLEECPSPIDINAVDEYGGTCLHWASSKGRKEVIQYLCMKGIDIHITSYDNKTAYQLAKDKHKQKCVQFLKNWYETSQKFVHAAEEGDDEEIARIIADINGAYPLRFMRDKNGKNAMHWAAEFGHLSTLKILSEHFAVWTDVDKFGRNALHSAALGGNKECAFWLIRKSRDSSEFLSLTLTNKSPSRCDEEENVAPRSRNIETVYNWLKFFKMEEYAHNFEKDGFDTLRGVATIDEEDLIDMDVKKGHRRVVLSHIEELRNQLTMLDENAQVAGMEPLSSPTLSMLPPITKQSSISSIVSAPGAPVAGPEAVSHRTERRGSITAPPLPADV
ncbi:hypothetical protein PRIC2_009111 [Phytophthora ramorum]